MNDFGVGNTGRHVVRVLRKIRGARPDSAPKRNQRGQIDVHHARVGSHAIVRLLDLPRQFHPRFEVRREIMRIAHRSANALVRQIKRIDGSAGR